MGTSQKFWYAVYTKPRWEKKVHAEFQEKGIESYCPMNRVRKQWSDRLKLVEEPLFKSYVFVHIKESDRPSVRRINGVLNFVYWNKKPALIPEREIIILKKFLNEFEEVSVQAIPLKKDQSVMIQRGILMNKTGKVKRVMNKNVEVIIESLGYVLIASIPKNNLTTI